MALEEFTENRVFNRVVDLPAVVVIGADDSVLGLRFTRDQAGMVRI
jgi:hypothetical protein